MRCSNGVLLLACRDEIKDGRVQLGPEVLNQLMANVDTVLSGTFQLAPATVSLFFMGLAELAVSDANKENLVQVGAIPRLKAALKFNQEVPRFPHSNCTA